MLQAFGCRFPILYGKASTSITELCQRNSFGSVCKSSSQYILGRIIDYTVHQFFLYFGRDVSTLFGTRNNPLLCAQIYSIEKVTLRMALVMYHLLRDDNFHRSLLFAIYRAVNPLSNIIEDIVCHRKSLGCLAFAEAANEGTNVSAASVIK